MVFLRAGGGATTDALRILLLRHGRIVEAAKVSGEPFTFTVGGVVEFGSGGGCRKVGDQIQPGTAAIFLLVRSSTADKVLPEMAKLGGTVIQTSLSTEQENQLKEALSHPTPAEA